MSARDDKNLFYFHLTSSSWPHRTRLDEWQIHFFAVSWNFINYSREDETVFEDNNNPIKTDNDRARSTVEWLETVVFLWALWEDQLIESDL